MRKQIKAMSLFANVGVAESYLDKENISVVISNELNKKRAEFYKHLYPHADMVIGDITCDHIKKELISKAKKLNVDLVIATPPCQGMSTVGKKDKNDVRNLLIKHAIDIVKEIKPDFVLFENVPEQLITKIVYNGKNVLIPDYISEELGHIYNFNKQFLINAADYGIPQMRERAIILLTKKSKNFVWEFPNRENKVITLEEAIGNLPSLDPELYDLSYEEQLRIFPDYENKKKKALEISKWHYPPKHIYRQVYSLMHTPSGKSAFDNIEKFKPRKKDGDFVKGFKNTYSRQSWSKPGYTITMYNRTIGSQNNVHPGRYIGKDSEGFDLYSDARVLTIYELMILTSLPKNWNIPERASDHFIRQVIGEGIPPLLIQKIMHQLVINNE